MKKILSAIGSVFNGGGLVGDVLDKFFPDKAEKMKFELELKRALLDEVELQLKDVQDARNMQNNALAQNDNFSKRFVYFISAGILLNAICAGLMSFFVVAPEANKEIVMMYYSFSFIIGGSQVLQFFFGTRQQNNNFNQNSNVHSESYANTTE